MTHKAKLGAKKKGLSPIIATLIIIAITIVGGIFLYKFFMAYGRTLTTYHDIEISSADLYVNPNMLIINVQNTGNVPVKALTVYLNGQQINASFSPLPLYGGGSASAVTSHLPLNVTAGQSYVIIVRAVFSDNSSQLYSTTVQATILNT